MWSDNSYPGTKVQTLVLLCICNGNNIITPLRVRMRPVQSRASSYVMLAIASYNAGTA